MQIRISMLVPNKNPEQGTAARALLRALRRSFPKGGSWLAANNVDPIVHGWWRQSKSVGDAKRLVGRRVDDRLILAWVDVWADDELALEDARVKSMNRMTKLFREHFTGSIQETEIYFNSQRIDVYFESGKPPEPPVAAEPGLAVGISLTVAGISSASLEGDLSLSTPEYGKPSLWLRSNHPRSARRRKSDGGDP